MKLRILLLLIFFVVKVAAQDDQKLKVYKIDMKNGTRLIGTIVSQNDSIVVLNVPELGELKTERKLIDKMVLYNLPRDQKRNFWFKNPNATRLFFAPTAIPLKRGEGYYQNIYVVGNMFNVGVTDFLSLGCGFDFITMFARRQGDWSPALSFNTKLGFKVHDLIHVGAGGILAFMPDEFSAGIVYGLSTFGGYNSNITCGLGWGFVENSFQEKPVFMLGTMARCSEKVWFVSENWIAPLDTDNDYYVVISYGLRFSGRRISVDLGFINSKDIIEALFIGIPYVDFVVKFGK